MIIVQKKAAVARQKEQQDLRLDLEQKAKR
jgi:hypothetical protein